MIFTFPTGLTVPCFRTSTKGAYEILGFPILGCVILSMLFLWSGIGYELKGLLCQIDIANLDPWTIKLICGPIGSIFGARTLTLTS